MFPLLILSLIFSAEALFSYTFISLASFPGYVIGIGHPILLVSAFAVLMKHFRGHGTTNYKKGFYAFGAMIALSVPLLGFLIPGVLLLFIDSNLIFWIGTGISSALFIAICYGIGRGRWNWKVHHVELEFENLPSEMNGTSIVQISDLHIGSFFNLYEKVKPAIEKINALKADYLVFTGDLVNNIVDELNGWEPLLKSMYASKGKFSILGNHDYGDYVKWGNDQLKNDNLTNLIEKHKEIGFTPLLNESVELHPNFHLLGVENWGVAPFRQSGRLLDTLSPLPSDSFKVLLSHDPSHFDQQVVGTGIELTLSGHTHGMQFGIERFGIKWSPVSLRYKKWAGLYQVGRQFLYVNRGFGYLGFPGRVGIYPEITNIVLKRK